jgi:hypothetical protein
VSSDGALFEIARACSRRLAEVQLAHDEEYVLALTRGVSSYDAGVMARVKYGAALQAAKTEYEIAMMVARRPSAD